MNFAPPPQLPSLLPESAPFTPQQRAWLNGFFAGLISVDGSAVTPLSPAESAAPEQDNSRSRIPKKPDLRDSAEERMVELWLPW